MLLYLTSVAYSELERIETQKQHKSPIPAGVIFQWHQAMLGLDTADHRGVILYALISYNHLRAAKNWKIPLSGSALASCIKSNRAQALPRPGDENELAQSPRASPEDQDIRSSSDLVDWQSLKSRSCRALV